jgi:hypothetical protein
MAIYTTTNAARRDLVRILMNADDCRLRPAAYCTALLLGSDDRDSDAKFFCEKRQ